MSIESDIQNLDQGINELRKLYDKYFAGIERIPPTKKHDELTALCRRLSTTTINNTALKFQAKNLVARYNTFSNQWNKIMRQIEAGTFKRDKQRAQKIQNNDAKTPAPTTNTQDSRQTSQSQPNPKIKELYDAYIAARQQCGQNANISVDALASSLKNQAAKLKEQYQCTGVSFKITVQNGKAIIKASPK